MFSHSQDQKEHNPKYEEMSAKSEEKQLKALIKELRKNGFIGKSQCVGKHFLCIVYQ